MSLVLFQYFLGVVTASLTCLVDRQSLLRKIRFPRLVIPLSVTLEGLFDLGMTLIAVFVFLIILGVYPDWGWLELIPLVGDPDRVRNRPRPAAERALRALPRHEADLGRVRADAVLRVADPLRRHHRAREVPRTSI